MPIFDELVVETAVHFFAQAADGGLDNVGMVGDFCSPDFADDVFGADGFAFVLEQELEQFTLFFGEFNVGAVTNDPVLFAVEREFSELQLVFAVHLQIAAVHGVDAGDEFLTVERFGHKVVGAEVEEFDFVADPAERAQDHDWNVEAAFANIFYEKFSAFPR